MPRKSAAEKDEAQAIPVFQAVAPTKKAEADAARTVAALSKRFGDGVVMQLGDHRHVDVNVISSGCIGLNIAMGVGGYPRGRIIEIYGPESVGKTTLCLHALAEAQRLGGICAFIDMEHAFDPDYAEALGVNVNKLYVAQPDSGEQALEILSAMALSKTFAMVIVDSVAALVPEKELADEMGQMPMGSQARLMSQAMRKLSGNVSKANTVVIFTNQLRHKIGVMYGNPETTTGGDALKYYATIRLDIRRVQIIKNGLEMIGARTRVKTVKNKVAPPFRETEFDLMFGTGIDKIGEILDIGALQEIITKRGASFQYGDPETGGPKLGFGREAAKRFLQEHPEISAEIEAKIMASVQDARDLSKKRAGEDGGEQPAEPEQPPEADMDTPL